MCNYYYWCCYSYFTFSFLLLVVKINFDIYVLNTFKINDSSKMLKYLFCINSNISPTEFIYKIEWIKKRS